MIKGLIKFLLLAGLALGAYSLPGLLDGGKAPGAAAKSALAGSLPRLPGLDKATGSKAGATAGRRAKGPGLKKHGDYRDGLLGFYYRHQAAAAYALWAAPAGALALALLLLLIKRYTLSMLLAGWVFSAANMALWGLSAAGVLSTVLTRQNLLAALPREIWLSPVAFLAAAAGFLRLADENYPFWNRAVTALFTPVAASFISAFWLIIAGELRKMFGEAVAQVS